MKKLKNPGGDSAQDILRPRQHPLDVFFAPESVALIGATEKPGSVGRTVLWNLISTPFGGTVLPGQPEAPERAGHQGLSEHRGGAGAGGPGGDHHAGADRARPDRASASRRACKGAIVISAGFKEMGPEGVELERQILAASAARQDAHHRPELPGRDEPADGPERDLRRARMARPGNVGFISQSGALCTAVLDWSLREKVGFSAFVSIGSMLDVGWGDLIDYLGDDPHTQSIVIYMEIDRRRALVPLGGARSGADQADHRDQGGAHGSGGQGGGLAHRLADRQRRSARGGVPAQRRAARQQHRRPVLHGRSAGEAAAPDGPAADAS